MFIAFEGIDGCGKTTQARITAERIGAVLTFEPGATPLGAEVRRLALGREVAVAERAETLLMLADRAQHLAEQILPELAAGRHVVTDRFSGSTLAYQGYGHGMDLDELEEVVAWATGGVAPDVNILVDVPPSLGAARRRGDPDRIEGLDSGFHERVAEGFRALAADAPEEWAVVDGTGTVEEVAAAVEAALRPWLEGGEGSG